MFDKNYLGHNFISIRKGLTPYKCLNCKCFTYYHLADNVYWHSTETHVIGKKFLITCNEQIIKDIIE